MPFANSFFSAELPGLVMALPHRTGSEPKHLLVHLLITAYLDIYINATLSICPTLSFPVCVYTSILYVWVSTLALKTGSSSIF